MRILLTLALFLTLLAPLPAFAAPDTASPPAASTQSQDASAPDAATEAEDPAPETAIPEELVPLTETLGVENFTQDVIHRYENFLSRSEFKGSTKGNWILTGVATVIALILSLLARTISTRLLFLVRRAFTWLSLPITRIQIYARILRTALIIAIAVLTLYAYTFIWDIPTPYNPFEHAWFNNLINSALNVFVVLALAALVWEAIQTALHVIFMRAGGANSTRATTVLPIVRNVVLIAFGTMFALVFLSEFGINIMPLLAGAGIIGIAIGFGAQTMVKDFLTGFTLIMEDVMRVGDVVTIAGISGSVEKITLRKIQLRGYTGLVSTIPFSAISIIQNMTKDFSAHEINMNVAYKENTDHVFTVMQRVFESMKNDPAFAPLILGDFEIGGVDQFADSAVVLKARIRTAAGKQWTVGREFNRRVKLAFDAEGIEIPLPQQVTWNMPQPQPAPQARES